MRAAPGGLAVPRLSLVQPERLLPPGAAHGLRQRHQLEVVGRVQLQLQGSEMKLRLTQPPAASTSFAPSPARVRPPLLPCLRL